MRSCWCSLWRPLAQHEHKLLYVFIQTCHVIKLITLQNNTSTATPTALPTTGPGGPSQGAPGTENGDYCGFSSGSVYACGADATEAASQVYFKRGDQAVVMLMVGVNGTQTCTNQTAQNANGTTVYEITCNNYTLAAQYFPIVDDYTVIEVPNCNSVYSEKLACTLTGCFLANQYVFQNAFVTVAVGTKGGLFMLSPGRSWYQAPYYVGFRSVYVTLSGGLVSSIDWDEAAGCGSCPINCVDNTCGMSAEAPIDCGDSCNIKVVEKKNYACRKQQIDSLLFYVWQIYLTWVGTDVDGIPMTSGNYAFSQISSWWPFSMDVLIYYASILYNGIGNGGFNEIDIDLSNFFP